MRKFVWYFNVSIIVILLASSCKNEFKSTEKIKTNTLKTGMWRAVLEVRDEKELPFVFELKSNTLIVIQNAEERIEVTDIIIEGDSITIQTPVFESVFKGKIISSELITGEFVKSSLNRIVPFKMVYGKANRFETSKKPQVDITENWETVFSPDSDENRYIAKGIFKQIGSKVTGTFRTTTGDYRYLEGVVSGDQLKLSTFDGAHAFLFEATVTDSIMKGFFYSGNHWKEPFVAKQNETYELPEATSLTHLKKGYDVLEFSFPNAQGEMVSIQDDVYKDKVVIVQIMGTWCPNCLDETKYYTQFYKEHKNEGIEFIALAFEYAKTEEKAFTAINRLQEKVGVPYPILLAQYGSSDKKKANEKLPMLNHILSYPTTIFIDKKGKVRRIHTGFNGSATGEKYLEFKKKFKEFVNRLLQE